MARRGREGRRGSWGKGEGEPKLGEEGRVREGGDEGWLEEGGGDRERWRGRWGILQGEARGEEAGGRDRWEVGGEGEGRGSWKKERKEKTQEEFNR